MPGKTPASEQPFLPRYEVTGLVGEGAAARVYRVTDRRSGAVRAIKALRAETNADPSVVKRFEDEFRILRGLHHPSLPEVHDYGFTEDGRRYIVMDLVDGRQLDDYFDEHPDDLWLLLYELCEVLVFIHDRNLLHLDLKPANILVKRTSAYGDEKPMVVLMDFGLSYRRESGEDVSLVGTPEYMAPEIIKGDDRITRAADYYSLGISLYKLLAGETPFGGTVNEVFAGHLREEVRFEEEKTVYAELYPHVLGLVGKEINPRLEAFEEFRRAVEGRLGGRIEELERAYGMSVISSIGMIGKDDVWRDVIAWLDQITTDNRTEHTFNDFPQTSKKLSNLKALSIEESSKSAIFTKGITDRLLSNVTEHDSPVVQSNVTQPKQLLIVGGPPRSGKSYLLCLLADKCRLHGLSPWALTSDHKNTGLGPDPMLGSLETLEASTENRSVDPASFLLDRFASGWSRLEQESKKKCAVLFVEDFGNLTRDQLGFLEYVLKRIEISLLDPDSPAIFILISGNNPKLRSDVKGLSGDKLKDLLVSVTPLKDNDISNPSDILNTPCPSADDKRNLRAQLLNTDKTAGRILESLKHDILEGSLNINSRWWSYQRSSVSDSSSDRRSLTQYYTNFVKELPTPARSVVDLICCHDGPVPVQTLLDNFSISKSTLDNLLNIQQLQNVVESNIQDGTNCVSISNQKLREAIYRNIPLGRRQQLHYEYANYYANISNLLSSAGDTRRIHTTYQLVHHYASSGNGRDALFTIVRLLKRLRADRHFLKMRSLCEKTLTLLDNNIISNGFQSIQHIRRYLLKQLITSYWHLSDYRSIRDIVCKYYGNQIENIPLGLIMRYCLALYADSQYDLAFRVTSCVRNRARNRDSVAHVTASLMYANTLLLKSKFEEARKELDKVESKMHLLGSYGRCRVYTCFVWLSDTTHDYTTLDKYAPLLEDISIKNKYYYEYLMANGAYFTYYFNTSRLEEARTLTHKAISIAIKHKLYRRLMECYFRASAVYYESGHYSRSIRYVQKALGVAKRIGLPDVVPELETRLAMNYQNSGLYGNALTHVNKAIDRWNHNWNASAGVPIYLFALDVHLSVNSDETAQYWKMATRYLKRHPEVRRQGYYWYLTGIYYGKMGKPELAKKAFSTARSIEMDSNATDDAVRAGIKEAFALIDQADYESAKRLIQSLRPMIQQLESKNIEAEFNALKLAYAYRSRANKNEINKNLRDCEKAMLSASEMPVLLSLDRIMFRAKARMGEIDEANQLFRLHLRRLKKILGNLTSRDYATKFLDDSDEKLLFYEYKIINK
jgi:serine/threonine protein kinase